MFFVHNRLYNYKFLKKILSRKSDFWIKLLKESTIGNPVPFFLYKSSSGNRIRHIYLLKQGFEFAQINNIDAVIEIGGGYGSMASVLRNINKNIEYTIYDLPEVNLLQYYYLRSQNIDCEISSLSTNINLLSEIELLKKIKKIKTNEKKILIIANWSLSEMPISLRKDLEFLFLNCDFAFVSFQDYFEDISNIAYFKELEKKLNNNFSISTLPIVEMNTIFNSNKHFSFLIKKW